MYFALTVKAFPEFPESELVADRLEKLDPASSSPTLAPLTAQGSRARAPRPEAEAGSEAGLRLAREQSASRTQGADVRHPFTLCASRNRQTDNGEVSGVAGSVGIA